MNTKQLCDKLLHIARNYITSDIKFIMWDNYEDMENCDKWKHTYDVLIEGTEYAQYSLVDFIKLHIPSEIYKTILAVETEAGESFYHDRLKLIAEHFNYGKYTKGCFTNGG